MNRPQILKATCPCQLESFPSPTFFSPLQAAPEIVPTHSQNHPHTKVNTPPNREQIQVLVTFVSAQLQIKHIQPTPSYIPT